MVLRVLGVVLLLIFVFFAGGIGKIIGEATSDKFLEGVMDGSTDNILMELSSRINRNLPIMVDSETRFDSAIGFGGMMQYDYTLVNEQANGIDFDFFKSYATPILKNKFCTGVEMKVFIENNISLKYVYFGKNGVQIASITISPNDCVGITKLQ